MDFGPDEVSAERITDPVVDKLRRSGSEEIFVHVPMGASSDEIDAAIQVRAAAVRERFREAGGHNLTCERIGKSIPRGNRLAVRVLLTNIDNDKRYN